MLRRLLVGPTPRLLLVGLLGMGFQRVLFARHPLFDVEVRQLEAGVRVVLPSGKMQIIGLLEGQAKLSGGGATLDLAPGRFSLVPASLGDVVVQAETPLALLRLEA